MFVRDRFSSPRSRFVGVSVIVGTPIALAACWAFAISGCENSSTTSSTSSEEAKTEVASNSTIPSGADSRCQQLLTSGLDMMKPENMGITSRADQVVDSLNNWARECGRNTPPANASAAKEGSEFADLYDLGDVEHVRDCWLIKQLSGQVVQNRSTDLERAIGLFELAVQTVALNSSADPVVAQTPYDIAVVGRGSAEDRAWLFAELLRQAGLDAVILRPKSSGPAASGTAPRWLVGVPIDKQVYLFDAVMGMPIPAADDKGTDPVIRKPATLAQVLASDELLRKLDVSPQQKYPLKAADLKSLQVQAITSSRYSQPRIQRLEAFLAGNRSVTVFAPLTDSGGRPGLLSRAAADGAGAWKKEDVVAWDYPDKQIAAAHHLDKDAQVIHDVNWLPFEGPVELEFDSKEMHWVAAQGTKLKKQKPLGGRPDQREPDAMTSELRHDARKQIKSRISQLQGDFPLAIRKFLLVQLEELPDRLVLPDEIQEQAAKQYSPEKRPPGKLAMAVPKREFAINFRAAEDAKFWMGVCQLSQNEPESAEETLNAYLRRYGGGGGAWVVQAAYLRGLALAQMKKYALAVQAVTQLASALPDNDVRKHGYEFLSERWRTLRDAAKPGTTETKPEAKPEEKPAAAPSKATAIPVKPAEPAPKAVETPAKTSTPAVTPPATKPAAGTTAPKGK